MTRIARRTKWRSLSYSEIERAMPWMKETHRYRMTVAICLLVMFCIPLIAWPVYRYIDGQWDEFMKYIWLYLLCGCFGFIAVYAIVDYCRKMKSFKDGDFQAADVTVIAKGIATGYRAHYYVITVNDLYVDDKPVSKKFKASKWLFDHVSEGDKAYVIKYNYKKTKDPLVDVDFVPATECIARRKDYE